MTSSYLINIILIVKVRLALCAHEVFFNLMGAPQSLALTTPTILDIVFAASTIEIFLFQVINEVCGTIEVDLVVWTDTVAA
jgi:hypothetical protein